MRPDSRSLSQGRSHALRRVCYGLGSFGLISAPTLSLAAEEGHHGEPHGIPWGTLLLTAVNFCLFLYVVVIRGIMPSVRRYAAERRDRVVREIEEAAAARAEAQRLRNEWEQRVANLEKEIAAIRRQALEDARRERDRILKAAQTTAAAIEADARRAATQEVERAKTLLRDDVSREAIAIAERLIRERLTAADQQRFVEEFLSQVRP